jgi:galactokinase/mevalonate kinase-like predicted kinase
MKYLVSVPPALTHQFHELTDFDPIQFFCTSDPQERNVGSGGGTAWILGEAWRSERPDVMFEEWLAADNRVIIHGGGKSRRLPAYSPAGKLLVPIPVFRWERGQKLNQRLIDLQIPLLSELAEASPDNTHTVLASGDALILTNYNFSSLPEADIISFGIPVDSALAKNHGVFVCNRSDPSTLRYMLQKPSVRTLREITTDNIFYIDVGIWLLSDNAVRILMKRSGWDNEKQAYLQGYPDYYDFYGEYGLGLGSSPTKTDPELGALTAAIVHIDDGEFYHFGTSRELISSCLALQNKVIDQKSIWTRNIKPHPAIFIQNTKIDRQLEPADSNVWIENSYVNENWRFSNSNIVTNVPKNEWSVFLPEGICIDFIPICNDIKDAYAIRVYGIGDVFKGYIQDEDTIWINEPVTNWFQKRGISFDDSGITDKVDIQNAPLFPVLELKEVSSDFIQWLINGENDPLFSELWIRSRRISASDILVHTDYLVLEKQRTTLRCVGYDLLSKNYRNSIFYQIDLKTVASEYIDFSIALPAPLGDDADLLTQIHDSMFRSKVLQSKPEKSDEYRTKSFGLLRDSIVSTMISKNVTPIKSIFEDQIVWGRSPVRIDLAGGWTDTPPHCIMEGGSVVTIEIELNGQPPLQVFIRPSDEKHIILRSIDLGLQEIVTAFDDLETYNNLSSAFSLPKAALCLCGFHPKFSESMHKTLIHQLDDFGGGFELSFMAAIPKGSGLGTSSVLSSTILGALSDFCGLGWDMYEICNRTLVLEQLLTSGGGWQDQYGGTFRGVKLLETTRGFDQTPTIKWLPDHLFIFPDSKQSMLLYYTGITRVANNILSEIVEGMFLNEHDRVSILKEIKLHSRETAGAIQSSNYEMLGLKVRKSWELNNLLDSGTNNTQIQGIIDLIDDYSLGYKLPGAGGGGFLFITAKDPGAALKIKDILQNNPPNSRARFVDMDLCLKGFEVSRS